MEMSALKFRISSKSPLMSVMAETHQSAMGPYVAMAEAAFESNSVTAVLREALLVNVSAMMARVRKWAARCPAVVSFFCLVMVVLVFWVLV